MVDKGLVTGSAEQAQPLVIDKDTVYVHTDITAVTEPDPITGEVPKDLYTYHEVQYTKDEYTLMMSQANENLQKQLEVTQEAIDCILLNQ